MLRFEHLLVDCEEYNGYKPCQHGNRCLGCVHYRPLKADRATTACARLDVAPGPASGILIIKTGALGDVLRTTSLLPNLADHHQNEPVTWLTDRAALPLLEGNPHISRTIAMQDLAAVGQLGRNRWRLLINLEKEPEPLQLAGRIVAERACGFAPTPFGRPTVFNREARTALLLGLDDDLKFRQNTKSYPQIVAEACGLPWRRDCYVLELGAAGLESRSQLTESAASRRIIGLNTGCGSVFRTKQWPEAHWVDLARRLVAIEGHAVAVLGGPAEMEMNRRIIEAVPGLIDGGCDRPLAQFIGQIDACSLLVSSDTLGMHIAIARNKPVVALFGSTSAVEIELYGRGEKVVTDFPCAPCYKRNCDFDPWCMGDMDAGRVEAAVRRWLE